MQAAVTKRPKKTNSPLVSSVAKAKEQVPEKSERDKELFKDCLKRSGANDRGKGRPLMRTLNRIAREHRAYTFWLEKVGGTMNLKKALEMPEEQVCAPHVPCACF